MGQTLDNSLVQGQFDKKTNKFDGRIVKILQDGTRYEGFCKQGLKHHFGRMIYANGDVYEGMWFEGKK